MIHDPSIFSGYKVRNISVSPGLVLAPMSGVTCRPFRRLIKKYNPGAVGLVVTEFISVEAMTRQVRRSLEMMRFDDAERPIAIQIFGFDIARMRDAALMVQESGADILDINCGCPAPKVVRKGGGCELMRQPQHLANILKAVRSAVSMPLTLKMRSGWDQNCRNATDIAHIAESEGVEALAVHGRTRAQLYRGEADYEVVWQVRDSVKIPVLGSGDVVDRESAAARLSKPVGECATPPSSSSFDRLAGVLIGRGAISNPLVFREILSNSPRELSHHEQLAIEILESYVGFLQEDFLPKASIGKVKQLASQMLRGYAWRKELLRASSFAEQIETIQRIKDGAWSRPCVTDPAVPPDSVCHSTEAHAES